MINEKLNKDILDLINENKTIINNLKGKILWTNPAPNNSFTSQTIDLSSDDYDFIEVIYRGDIQGNLANNLRCIKGKGFDLNMFSNATTNRRWSRRLVWVNNKKFTAYDCTRMDDFSTTNDNCVPLYIIGYKTGLFS